MPCRFACVMYAVMVMLTLSGCGKSGPKAVPVAGKVSNQGKPIASASIRFNNPELGVDMIANLDDEGKYSVVAANGPGLPEGTYRVAIIPSVKNAPVGTFGTPPTTKRPDIPEKYRSPTTSGLTITVRPGADFDVKL